MRTGDDQAQGRRVPPKRSSLDVELVGALLLLSVVPLGVAAILIARVGLLVAISTASALAVAAALALGSYITRSMTRLVEGAAEDVQTTRQELEARSRSFGAWVEERTQALRESEERFRLLFAASPLPLWVYDRATLRFLEVNEAAIALYGYSREEFLGMRGADLSGHEDPRRHRVKDGRIIDVEVFAHPLQFCGREAVLVAIHDVTERVRVEAQLRQSQKMDAVGWLAGGIAHDFNNLMTVIMSRGELLRTRLSPDSRSRRDVELINKTARRAAELTRRLLAFSRRQVLQPRVLGLDAVVSGMLDMLRRLIREDIELVTRLGAARGRIKGDPAQLEQVILNLVVNARDAMPDGGVLTIETGEVEADEAFVRHHPGARPGPHVALTVEDTGRGMDAETLAHIFEPFFTTKGPDRGTGLGLATVYGVTKQHDGYIVVESEPGRGARFTVYLPRVEDAVQAVDRPAAPKLATSGSETVLVVEDEAEVRTVAREILKEQGYTVLEANNGAEALGICGGYSGPIHLLVTDVVLPKLGGAQLARRLVGLRPSMKILYISGYAAATLGREVVDDGVAFLPKPFTPDELAEHVRKALDGRVLEPHGVPAAGE